MDKCVDKQLPRPLYGNKASAVVRVGEIGAVGYHWQAAGMANDV